MKRVILILVAMTFFAIFAKAQDVIIKKDASEIEAKVLEITDMQIKYKDFDFQDGPIRNINLSEVFMIIYQNGKREVFNKKPIETTSQNDRRQNSETKENISKEPSIFENSSYYTVLSELNLLITPSLGSCTWFEAREKCKNLSQGEFKDWYLPSKDEFEIILKNINTNKEKIKECFHWTSSEIDYKKAYNIYTKSGWATSESKTSNSPNCLCIRKILNTSSEPALINNETSPTTITSISESVDVKNSESADAVYLPENMQSRKDVIVRVGYGGFQTKIMHIDDKYIYHNNGRKDKKIKQSKVAYTLTFNETAKHKLYPTRMDVKDFMSLPVYFGKNGTWTVFGTIKMSNLAHVRKIYPEIYEDFTKGKKKQAQAATLSLIGIIPPMLFFPPWTLGFSIGSLAASTKAFNLINNSITNYYATCVNLGIIEKYGIIVTPYKMNPFTLQPR